MAEIPNAAVVVAARLRRRVAGRAPKSGNEETGTEAGAHHPMRHGHMTLRWDAGARTRRGFKYLHSASAAEARGTQANRVATLNVGDFKGFLDYVLVLDLAAK